MSKKPQSYLEDALKEIENQVKNILNDNTLPLTEKDRLIYPYVQKKRVLTQAIEDLNYLDERDFNLSSSCKMSQYR